MDIEYELLTQKQTLKYLKITRSTLYRWIKKRGFPMAMKLSSQKALWRKAEIDEWMTRSNYNAQKHHKCGNGKEKV